MARRRARRARAGRAVLSAAAPRGPDPGHRGRRRGRGRAGRRDRSRRHVDERPRPAARGPHAVVVQARREPARATPGHRRAGLERGRGPGRRGDPRALRPGRPRRRDAGPPRLRGGPRGSLRRDDRRTRGGPDDPVATAAGRQLDYLAALRSYDIAAEQQVHAMRTVRSLFHGFASIQSASGFQLGTDVDESFEWLIEFADRRLRAMACVAPRGRRGRRHPHPQRTGARSDSGWVRLRRGSGRSSPGP
ncbi:TetR-like C-terminal domain-containing protein [Pseudonocardia nematodicida]|uniref:TetR-like C-terminal domain-containing protein n=1 Tax=Pseudonocardia nematodicida TaxID=1206997 RepID=UPI0036066B0F